MTVQFVIEVVGALGSTLTVSFAALIRSHARALDRARGQR